MTRGFTYSKSRVFGTLMMTIYALGLLPLSYSMSCSDASQPTRPVLTETDIIYPDSATACISRLRTIPYPQALAEKYRYMRLAITGAHTPQVPPEKNFNIVPRAKRDRKTDFLFAVDKNYSFRNSFNNQYWPGFYFTDVKGRVFQHQSGEVRYRQAEKLRLQLLANKGFLSRHFRYLN